jgi:hypothetical protein
MATELAYGRMLDLTIRDVSPIIPAKHFDISKAFYMALGWKLIEIDPTLAALELANRRLYLQNFYIRRWADNMVLTIAVEDAYAWHEHISGVLRERKFPGTRVHLPKLDLDGTLTTCASDPSGVSLHFVQWNS